MATDETQSYNFQEVNRRLAKREQYGATADRPSNPSKGEQFFDTDLGKPIWYDGTNWVDATGATV